MVTNDTKSGEASPASEKKALSRRAQLIQEIQDEHLGPHLHKKQQPEALDSPVEKGKGLSTAIPTKDLEAESSKNIGETSASITPKLYLADQTKEEFLPEIEEHGQGKGQTVQGEETDAGNQPIPLTMSAEISENVSELAKDGQENAPAENVNEPLLVDEDKSVTTAAVAEEQPQKEILENPESQVSTEILSQAPSEGAREEEPRKEEERQLASSVDSVPEAKHPDSMEEPELLLPDDIPSENPVGATAASSAEEMPQERRVVKESESSPINEEKGPVPAQGEEVSPFPAQGAGTATVIGEAGETGSLAGQEDITLVTETDEKHGQNQKNEELIDVTGQPPDELALPDLKSEELQEGKEAQAPLLLPEDEIVEGKKIEEPESEPVAATLSPETEETEKELLPLVVENNEMDATLPVLVTTQEEPTEEIFIAEGAEPADRPKEIEIAKAHASSEEDDEEPNSQEESEPKEEDDIYARFIAKYYGEKSQALQIGKEEVGYLFAKADYDIFELMKKAVTENDPDEPLDVDANLVKRPELLTPVSEDSGKVTYGGEKSVFADYDHSIAKAIKEGRLVQAPVAKPEERQSEEHLSLAEAGEINSTQTSETQSSPLKGEEDLASGEYQTQKEPAVAAFSSTLEASGEIAKKPVGKSSQAVSEPEEIKVGTTTIEVNGTPVEVKTYTDRSGTWNRVNEILEAGNYSGSKDVRKATGILAGFKNLRRIRPRSEDGTEQKPEVFVNEAGLRKMLAKLERRAKKLATSEKNTVEVQDLKPAKNIQPSSTTASVVTPKTHFIEFDSEGAPIVRMPTPVGPKGGTALVKLDGKDFELPAIEADGEVWFYVGNLLQEISSGKDAYRSKAIRRRVDDQNLRLFTRSIFGKAPNNYLHMNKAGLKQLLTSILSTKPVQTATQVTPSAPQSRPAVSVPPVQVQTIHPQRVSSSGPTPATQKAGIATHGFYRPSLRIIIDDQHLFVRGYEDQYMTWYATPAMLEFAGIVGSAEQKAFLAKKVDPKEIREIYEEYGDRRLLEPHVSRKGLLQLIPALNEFIKESRKPQYQAPSVALPNGATGRNTGWMPSRAYGPSIPETEEALRFSKEAMNINRRDVTIRTIKEGNKVWYEAKTLFEAAGMPNEAEQTYFLSLIVTPEHQYRPIGGTGARAFVDEAGLQSIFEALGTIYGPSQVALASTNNETGEGMGQQSQMPGGGLLRLGETVVGLLGRQVNVKTAMQDGSVWFYANDLMNAFNQFQQEEGGRLLGSHGHTKYVNAYVSAQNIRQIQQRTTGNVGTRKALHINVAGLAELEQALLATRAGKEPPRAELDSETIYRSAQEEVNAIAARIHGEQKMKTPTLNQNEPESVEPMENATEQVAPVENMIQPPENVQPIVQPVPLPPQPSVPPMPAQPPAVQSFAAPQMQVSQPLQPGMVQPHTGVQPLPPQMVNPLTGQPVQVMPQSMQPMGQQMPIQQMPISSQMPLQNPGMQWPQMPQATFPPQGTSWSNPMAPQPMQGMQPVHASSPTSVGEISPKQIYVQDPVYGTTVPPVPADVFPLFGREIVIRKKIEQDGAWYNYQDLFDQMGIMAGSPVMAMFANVVQQGAFRSALEPSPFGYKQVNYVNGIGMIEIISELERMTQNVQQTQSQMPMQAAPVMPQYQQVPPVS
ncbi:MAG: hypothetical protein LUC43_09980, partial [Burkholderiales bacterium]|nr:hypothetical protein [Burkholderiales bacterium]